MVRCSRSTFPFRCGEYGAVGSAAHPSSPAARFTASARNSRPPSNRISCGTPPHGPRSGSITIPSRITTSTSALRGIQRQRPSHHQPREPVLDDGQPWPHQPLAAQRQDIDLELVVIGLPHVVARLRLPAAVDRVAPPAVLAMPGIGTFCRRHVAPTRRGRTSAATAPRHPPRSAAATPPLADRRQGRAPRSLRAWCANVAACLGRTHRRPATATRSAPPHADSRRQRARPRYEASRQPAARSDEKAPPACARRPPHACKATDSTTTPARQPVGAILRASSEVRSGP